MWIVYPCNSIGVCSNSLGQFVWPKALLYCVGASITMTVSPCDINALFVSLKGKERRALKKKSMSKWKEEIEVIYFSPSKVLLFPPNSPTKSKE